MKVFAGYFQIFVISLVAFAVGLLTSGYGYMGNLPKLGEKTKAEKQVEAAPVVKKASPEAIIVPRIVPAYKVSKYSNYLADIKKIDGLLREIKTILENNTGDKVQFFCAKVNLLNLYITTFKEKYRGSPEQYYESYKQLVVLDKYLTEIVDYRRGIEHNLDVNYKSLENRAIETKFLNRKMEKAIIPISTVIEIIDETG